MLSSKCCLFIADVVVVRPPSCPPAHGRSYTETEASTAVHHTPCGAITANLTSDLAVPQHSGVRVPVRFFPTPEQIGSSLIHS